MVEIRKSEERGHANHGWLDTYHSFSFNTYHDERYMGFRSLRVINEDRVKMGKGFGTHPHKDMEIITYVLEGALEHRDSMDNGSVIRPGDVQRMSAGTGITHSEFNASLTDPVHLLQIWILPNKLGLKPSYEQKTFTKEEKLNKMQLIASQDGRLGSVSIDQDVKVYAAIVEPDHRINVPISENRHVWVHVVHGLVKLGEHVLSAGDGVAVSRESELLLLGIEESEILVFDLA